MSIQSEITRISGNVADALTAISNKGVTVPQGANSDDLATLIAQIEGGGDEPVGPTYETIVPLQTINCTIDLSNGAYGGYITPYTEYIQSGEKYRVYYDGAEYGPLTATYYGDGTTYLYVGDVNAMLSSSATLTYPFVIMLYNGSAFYLAVRGSGSHTLQVDKMTSEGSGGGGDTSSNPLAGKIATFTGDSICAGGEEGGYAGIIRTDYGMTVENLGVYDGTVVKWQDKFCISESIADMRSDADFVILEGGGNDADWGPQYIPVGTLTSGYNDTLDTTTFAGAFEYMLKSAINKFSSAKIGYIFVHKCVANFDAPNGAYHSMAIAALEKWGIPYCDLNVMVPPLGYIDDLKTAYTRGDGIHPNEAGYRTFYVPKIVAFMQTMLTDKSLINKTVTANGTYSAEDDAADGYSSVTVNVPASAVDSGTKSITANGSNQDVVGYAAVNVNVPNTYTAADEGKVVSSGALVAQTAHAEVTQNGTIDTTLNNSVTVNVSGGASYDGIEIKTSGTTVTEYACHMSTIPDFALNYIDFTKGVNDGLSQITFPVKPTHVGKRAFFQAKARIDWSGLSDMETADEYALASAYISQADWTGDEVTLPSFVGYTSSHNAQNLFRFDGSAAQTYCPKKYSLPVCEVIPQFMLYGIRASNIDVTIGSVGHAVTESKNQPFGSSSNASGTVVIYTTGSYLDSVKTAVQNGLGSNITLTFKASEATTYGGSSYAAGATILTV